MWELEIILAQIYVPTSRGATDITAEELQRLILSKSKVFLAENS